MRLSQQNFESEFELNIFPLKTMEDMHVIKWKNLEKDFKQKVVSKTNLF